MTAETPLWREQDGPTCREGGRAHVDLQWRGDRIAVGSASTRQGWRLRRTFAEVSIPGQGTNLTSGSF